MTNDKIKNIIGNVKESEVAEDETKQASAREKLSEITQKFEKIKATNGSAYCIVPSDQTSYAYEVDSEELRHAMRHIYKSEHKKFLQKNTIEEAIENIKADIFFDKAPAQNVYERVGADSIGNLYIDINDGAGNAIKITPKGHSIVNDAHCRFIRSSNMATLPFPAKSNGFNQLRELLNIQDDDSWVLIVSWIFSAYMPKGPYPILIVQGEHGSGKSILCRIVADLVHPTNSYSKNPASKTDDLMISAKHDRVLSFDNMSGCSVKMSDTLCRISTGIEYEKRTLFSDGNKFSFNACRPIILNGIDGIAHRHDLANRAFTVYMPPISSTKRKSEKVILEEFQKMKPALLGAICETLSCILKNKDSVMLETVPRMADAVMWVSAGYKALDWKSKDALIQAIDRNNEYIIEEAIDDSPLAQAIIKIMEEQRRLDCLNKDLFEKVKDKVPPHEKKNPDFPRTY